MGNQASKIQRETERWFERIKTGRRQRARMRSEGRQETRGRKEREVAAEDG